MEASTSRENEEDLKDIMDLIDIMDLKDITDLIGQSCKLSNLLHGANLPNQVLPQEKRVNCDKFNTSKE